MEVCPHPERSAVRLFAARDYITGDEFEIWRCERCGLARTCPEPPPERAADYYPSAYYGTSAARRFPGTVEALQRFLYARRARAGERLAGAPGRVLDVGCGRGFLLEAFRRRGWTVQGTELDERSATYAREVLGLPVETLPVASWPWPDGHFDAVAVWHVLEHLSSPADLLERARRLLRPGGVLLVGVPNFASPEARLARGAWFHADVPRHLAHFTPEWLDRALDASGLDVRSRSFLSAEFDVFSFVQSAENRLGLRPNLLYDVLRGRGAKVLGRGAGLVQAIAAVLLAVPLGVVAVPATTLLGLAGLGSSITVLATRRS